MTTAASGDLAQLDALQLLDAAPDAIVVVDERQRIVLVNAQAEVMFGYARAELMNAELTLLIPERFHSTHQGHVERYAAKPTTRAMGSNLELRARCKSGVELPVEVSLSPVHTSAGQWVCAAVRDVSERKRMEDAARVNAERLASAVESIEDALALYDAQQRLVLCNSAYRALLGADAAGAMVGRSYDELQREWLPQLEISGEAARAQFLAQRAQPWQQPRSSTDVRTRDGRSLRVMTRRTNEGGIVETIWDLTSDVQHAEQLREARAAAEAASTAKSEFLSAMSHELRTPLNAILGFAQLLHRDKKAPLAERHKERIEHVLKGGQHLLSLIDEILDLSRIEAGRVPISLEPVEIESVLGEVEATLSAAAARHMVALRLPELSSPLPQVVADRVRFKQILMNFVSNAIKYGRSGGAAELYVRASGDSVRVGVRDDGPGIAADKQARIFEPFFRAGQESGSVEGTGIGLAISKRLAELMAGRVGFESAQGVGTDFWVELPVHHEQPSASRAPRAAPLSVGARLVGPDVPRHLLLYVEDNPSNIAFMEDLLGDFDAVELVVAPTAELGLEVARARLPRIIIMDINLPGMSGLEATRRLKQWPETSAIPVIGLSAAATARDTARAEEVGFYRYLTKPVQVDDLARTLEELLLPER